MVQQITYWKGRGKRKETYIIAKNGVDRASSELTKVGSAWVPEVTLHQTLYPSSYIPHMKFSVLPIFWYCSTRLLFLDVKVLDVSQPNIILTLNRYICQWVCLKSTRTVVVFSETSADLYSLSQGCPVHWSDVVNNKVAPRYSWKRNFILKVWWLFVIFYVD